MPLHNEYICATNNKPCSVSLFCGCIPCRLWESSQVNIPSSLKIPIGKNPESAKKPRLDELDKDGD